MADLDAELGSRLARLAESVPVAPWLGHVEPGPVAARHRIRMAWMTPLVVITLAVVSSVLLNLSIGPRPGPSGGSSPGTPWPSPRPDVPVHASATSGNFLLEIMSPKASYLRTEAIDVRARLTNTGPESQVLAHAYGAGQTPLGFGIEEPVLGDLTLGPSWETICTSTSLLSGASIEQPFRKSAGWSSDHPRAAEYEAFARDPELRLSPGTWHIFVEAWFSVGDCSAEATRIRAEIEIEVLDQEPTGEDAVHIVNVDGPTVEVLMDGAKVATVACGGSAALIATGVPRGLPWTLEFWTSDGEHLETLTVEGPLPWGVLIRGAEVLNGPWPMSYGPAPAEPPCNDGLDAGVSGTDADGPYSVELRSARKVYYESDVIDVTGTFSYTGEARVEVWGLLLGFSIDEPVHGIDITAIHPLMCGRTDLQPGHALETPFAKGGGVSGDDPLYDMKLAYLRDPVFRLPPGMWHLRYGGSLFDGECGPKTPQRSVSTMIEIIVLPDTERP